MQDPGAAFQAMRGPAQAQAQAQAQFPEQEQLKCPRCESLNTKFCYYNNYNLSQPRHFCKNCRRYWTKGGALRNIPVGGGTRKASASAAAAKRSSANPKRPAPSPSPAPRHADPPQHDPHRLFGAPPDVPGSFSSLLASNGAFEGFAQVGPGGSSGQDAESGRVGSASEGFLGLQSGDWGGGGNGWPGLAIYTPGSSFQ